MLLTWQGRGSSVCSGVQGGECGKEAAVRAALKPGSWKQQRDNRGRGGGGSATLNGNEAAATARHWRVEIWRRQRGSGGRGVCPTNNYSCTFLQIITIVKKTRGTSK